MLIAAPLVAGLFIFTLALWYFGFGASATVATSERLARLSGNGSEQSLPLGSRLRRRTAVNLGGINFVNANMAQNWAMELERAGLTINTKEYLVLRIVVSAVFALVAALAVSALFAPMPIIALGAAPIGFLAVGFWVKHRISSRTHKMEAQLVELLQMIASGLRAGFGLVQAMEQASEQLPAPISLELRRSMRDMAMGASVEQALTALNERVGSADFDIVVTAILIQRSVGGNLAEILDNVAHTMRERERIRGEIRTLTSQQRLTGYVIGGIPIGLLIIFSIISPEFVGLLFTEPLGRMMLIGAAVMEVLGFFVISRIVNIEV